MQQVIENRVIQVAREVLETPPDKDILDMSISQDLAPTSVDQMTLFIALEDEFQQSIPQEDVADIDTLREVINYLIGIVK